MRTDAIIRPFNPAATGELNLVRGSWKANARRCPPLSALTSQGYDDLHGPVVAALLVRCPPIMAVSPRDPWLIYGYLCGERPSPGVDVLHMVYVKEARRQQGVAAFLLRTAFGERNGAPLYHTHMARGVPWCEKRWNLVFDPYLARSLA